jgi:general secretion pathway protein G
MRMQFLFASLPDCRISLSTNRDEQMSKKSSAAGFTLIELIIAVTILSVLCGMAQPLATFAARREKERILRDNLRKIREAIDSYNEASMAGKFLRAPSYGYPPNLQALVDPIELRSGMKLQLLREIPLDPITGDRDWGVHSMEDDPESDSWNGDQIWDVYSKAAGTGLDGIKYRDW